MGVLQEAQGGGDVQPVGPFDRHAAVRTAEVALVRPGEGQVIGAEGAGAPAHRADLAARAGRRNGSRHRDNSRAEIVKQFRRAGGVAPGVQSRKPSPVADAPGSPNRRRLPIRLLLRCFPLASTPMRVRQSIIPASSRARTGFRIKEEQPMSWSLRRVLVVLTAVAACGTIACLQTAFAQQPGRSLAGPISIGAGNAGAAHSPAAPTPASFDLPRDTEARGRIVAAHEYIDAKRWPEVVTAHPARPRRRPGQVRPARPQGAGRQGSRSADQRPGRGQPPARRSAGRGPGDLQDHGRSHGRRTPDDGQGR